MDEMIYDEKFINAFRSLDDSVKVPDMPPVDAIFEKAGPGPKKEGKVLHFGWKRIAGIAAVIAVCAVAARYIPLMGSDTAVMKATAGSRDMTMAVTEEAEEPAVPAEGPAPESGEAFDEAESFMIAEEGPEETSAPAAAAFETEADSIPDPLYDALCSFFAANAGETKTGTADVKAQIFTVPVNGKRSAEVSVSESSVSVILTDTEGEPEIMKTVIAEGAFQSHKLVKQGDSNVLIVNLSYRVTADDMENMDYVPEIIIANGDTGDMDTGDSVVFGAEEPLMDGIYFITVTMNADTGETDVSCVLR